MNKLILVGLLVLTTIGCISTPATVRGNSHYIETTEFLHSENSNGFEEGKAQWLKLANKICGEDSVGGELQYRNSKNNVRELPAIFAGTEKWIVAFGEATCESS